VARRRAARGCTPSALVPATAHVFATFLWCEGAARPTGPAQPTLMTGGVGKRGGPRAVSGAPYAFFTAICACPSTVLRGHALLDHARVERWLRCVRCSNVLPPCPTRARRSPARSLAKKSVDLLLTMHSSSCHRRSGYTQLVQRAAPVLAHCLNPKLAPLRYTAGRSSGQTHKNTFLVVHGRAEPRDCVFSTLLCPCIDCVQ